MSDPFGYLSRAGVAMKTQMKPMRKVRASVGGAKVVAAPLVTRTKKPNIEGNESAKYEALEKKSLRGVSDTDLRDGRSTKGRKK